MTDAEVNALLHQSLERHDTGIRDLWKAIDRLGEKLHAAIDDVGKRLHSVERHVDEWTRAQTAAAVGVAALTVRIDEQTVLIEKARPEWDQAARAITTAKTLARRTLARTLTWVAAGIAGWEGVQRILG